jgi:GTP cyclohydrolase II
VTALRDEGIDVVEVRPLAVSPTASNAAYLRAKRERLGDSR